MKSKKKKKKVVAVSGGFDPIHAGHVRLFEAAKKLGEELVVILNNDNWLRKKKRHRFMSEKERREVLESIKWVNRVVLSRHPKNPSDMSVCRELKEIRPSIFANGGDRNKKDSSKKESSLNPEVALCRQLGIEMRFNVGKGGKVQSSSWLLNKYVNSVSQKKKA